MAGAAAAQGSRPAQGRRALRRRRTWRLGRSFLLLAGSTLLLIYALAPVAWLITSSFQSEREIVSKPPHWIPHEPTMQNFAAIFAAKDKNVTYETRRAA